MGNIYKKLGNKEKSDEYFRKMENIKIKTENLKENINICSYCLELLDFFEISKTTCGHSFHTNCLNEWKTKYNNCPNCRAILM